MEELLADTATATRLQRKQLTDQLRELETEEGNLLDLAADGGLATVKVQRRLREISERRQHLTAELESVKSDLKQGAKYIDLCLTLIANPAQLYATASDEVRRQLNQAIFKRLYIHAEEITGHDLSSPLAELVAADAGYRAQEATGDAEQGRDVAHASYVKHTGQSKGAVISDGAKLLIDDLLLTVNARADCSKDSMVRILQAYLNHVTAGQRLKRILADAERGGRAPRTTPLPKPAKQKSIAEVEQMVGLWYQCGNVLEIARVMKVHESTVRSYLREAGIETAPRVLTADDLAEIQRLKADEYSYRQIASKTGWSRSSVGKALRGGEEARLPPHAQPGAR